MQENNLYEYAIIRIVPRVEREEFLNVGIILFCKKQNFLDVRYAIDENKIYSLCQDVDLDEFKAHLIAYKKIALSEESSGPIGELETGERFRWLTATRSTILQSSKVHPGITKDLEITLQKLFTTLVL